MKQTAFVRRFLTDDEVLVG